MNNRRWLLPLMALLCAACASGGRPPAAPAAVPQPSANQADGELLREDLERVYDTILARGRTSGRPRDFEAAASIPIPDHPTIAGAVKYFSTTLRPRIQASLLRSARYRKMIDGVLEEHRLPKALAYLPVIESAFIPTLTSRVGAHGIWQFMPETAREYGMRVDWWVDERADPHRSTRAAAEYLKDLHRQFGDWSLALAAYNCGPGRVRRALDRTGSTSFWEILELTAIPKETRGYVPTFYATLLIASDPDLYGFRVELPADIDEKEVEVLGPLSLEYLAEVTGTDPSRLRELNPSLHRGIVPPGKRAVRVPAAVAPIVAEHAVTMRDDDTSIAVTAFTLRKGDTVAKLARKLSTTAETILEMNNLSSDDSIRAGRSIYVPVAARELGTLLRHSDDKEVFYTVRKGDTLYSIARRHNVDVADMCELNDLSRSAKLKPGQKLRVTPPRGLTAGSM